MSKLKLGPIADDKPLKVQVELPGGQFGYRELLYGKPVF